MPSRRSPLLLLAAPGLLWPSLATGLAGSVAAGCVPAAAMAQQAPEQTSTPQPGSTEHSQPPTAAPPATMFSHPDRARYLVAGQANVIFQGHPGFHSPYSGPNSLLGRGEYKTSLVGTLFLGYQVNPSPRFGTDVIYDEESSGGRGVSEALGLAGFTNLDVVRNPTLGSVPYTARVQVHQTIGFTSRLQDVQRTQFSLATKAPERRLDLRVGRMSLPDVMDVNGPGSDSHLQFLNWTADNNGAWDYAADTRGYTYAGVAEYDDRVWSARYALALMPTVANGPTLEWNLRRAHGSNYEVEVRRTPLGRLAGPERHGTVRLLAFDNHANMGTYRVQNVAALTTQGAPDITAHPFRTTAKYGFGGNFEQELPGDVRVFGRFGWNEGQHESFCYTEVDQTFEVGGDLAGTRWGRAQDKVGVAAISNAIKRDHQRYLAAGGMGFLLGDGRLRYAREDILEAYYTAHHWRGLFTALDVQVIAHPGYNVDRGPVAMLSVRTHVDF